jgi:hypothetical protein
MGGAMRKHPSKTCENAGNTLPTPSHLVVAQDPSGQGYFVKLNQENASLPAENRSLPAGLSSDGIYYQGSGALAYIHSYTHSMLTHTACIYTHTHASMPHAARVRENIRTYMGYIAHTHGNAYKHAYIHA